MHQAWQVDVDHFINRYLTEEDKDRLCSGNTNNDVKMFPGSDRFFLLAEARRVKDFVECGHFFNVLGFGVDFFLGRDFSHAWTDITGVDEIDDHIREIMNEPIHDNGYVADDFELDKMYAWTRMSPHYAMSITAPMIKKLQDTSRMLWASCVMKSDGFGIAAKNVANCMMKNIITKWAETVIIPHEGIGERNLLE